MRVKKLWEKPSTLLLTNLLITNMVQALVVQPLQIAKSLKCLIAASPQPVDTFVDRRRPGAAGARYKRPEQVLGTSA